MSTAIRLTMNDRLIVTATYAVRNMIIIWAGTMFYVICANRIKIRRTIKMESKWTPDVLIQSTKGQSCLSWDEESVDFI